MTVSRPHPLWSEQDPEQWWQATDRAMKALGDQHSLQDVKSIGYCRPDARSNLAGCSATGVTPCHFIGTTGAVRKSALCWKREFRNRG
ncbi:FGGY family carbohydrate kinase [Escherichia coli]